MTMEISYEYWHIAKPETTTDDNGLITDLNMSWEEVAQFASDEDLYDMFAGASDEFQDAFSDDDNADLVDRLVYSNMNTLDGPDGVSAFKISQKAITTTSGFAVGYEFGNVSRPWFKDEQIISDDKRDYAARYGKSDTGAADSGGRSKTLLKELFDRRPSEDYSFADTFNSLTDTYVKNIYATLGELKETSATYKQSPKRKPSLKDTSTFDLDGFEQDGVQVATSTITTTLTTGGY